MAENFCGEFGDKFRGGGEFGVKNSREILKLCGCDLLDLDYSAQIALKSQFLANLFSPFFRGEIEIFASKTENFRNRIEFGISHKNGTLNYTMRAKNGEFLALDECFIAEQKINAIMPKLLEILRATPALNERLFGCEFIATSSEILAVLLYHKNVEEIAQNLEKIAEILSIKIIARSRKKKLIFDGDNLNEILRVNGEKIHYTFGDGAFIQPNKSVNEMMISWALSCVGGENFGDEILGGGASFEGKNNRCDGDLLELYCGHGNFTLPLSRKFRQVLATEISKISIKNALKNCELNRVKNVRFLRMSAEELMAAFRGEREFRRLLGVDLGEFKFSHIFVDPPRAGCDESVLNFIKNYENIIYISCNPLTLFENLKFLTKTHKIAKFAMFDQFVHTKHIECGVLLKRG